VSKGVSRNRRLQVLAAMFSAVLTACGGGGGDGVSAPPPGAPPSAEPEPAVPLRWVSSASELVGIDSDGGVPSSGRLVAADPQGLVASPALSPATVENNSLRIVGGAMVNGMMEDTAPRHVLFDARTGTGTDLSFGLHRLSLGASAAGAAAPAVQRIGADRALCRPDAASPSFKVIGQDLTGETALITYAVPDLGRPVSLRCSPGLPRGVVLTQGGSTASIALPTAATERVVPIAPIHNANGRMESMLAWRDGSLVTVNAELDLSRATATNVSAPEPLANAPTYATASGIFYVASDGLRRYDKAQRLLSGRLVEGSKIGAAFERRNALHDDDHLYIASEASGGSGVNLYSVSDRLVPETRRINDEPISGFWVLRSYVLYTIAGKEDEGYVVYDKRSRQNLTAKVLAGKQLELASTLSDRVFHSTFSPLTGAVVLASSEFDGGSARSLGDSAQLLGGSIAKRVSPYARNLRGNGFYSHALVVVAANGALGLEGAQVRWVSFGAESDDVNAGVLPTVANVSLGPVAEGPGVMGNAAMLGIVPAQGGEPVLFTVRRASDSVRRVQP
jgi:hypothetical protein